MNYSHAREEVIVVRRLAVILSATALFVALATSSASARGAKWEFLPAEPLTLPASSCGFPVALDFPRNEEFAKATPNPDGSTDILLTGAFHVSATNTDSGKAVVVNASGPGHFHLNPDGSQSFLLLGNTVNAFDSAAQAESFGAPSALFLWAGQSRGTVDADGNLTNETFRGHMRLDICAALS
jgi:hypothetical protein